MDKGLILLGLFRRRIDHLEVLNWNRSAGGRPFTALYTSVTLGVSNILY